MSGKRRNTATTHFQHVDRIHSRRIVELATGICEKVIDLDQVTYAECLAEQRRLTEAINPLQEQAILAKRQGWAEEALSYGNHIAVINRRLGACKLKLKELNVSRSGEGKRCLKVAMREMLPPEQVAAIFHRANEIEAASDREWRGEQ